MSAVGAGIRNVLQQSGHYIACIKQDLQWYKFDDSVVSAIEVADLKQVPSLLVLESAGNPGRSSQKLLRQRNNNQINVVEDSAVGDANTAAAPSGIQSMADEKHCASATTSQRKRPAAKPMSGLEKYFRVVGRNNSNKLGSNNARASEEEPDNSEDVIDVQTAHTSNMPSRERPPDSRGHRSRSHGPQDRRGADRSQQERFSRNCVAKAAKDSQLHVQNAISAEATPSEIFKFRLSLPEPAGDDDVLRIFPGEPVPLPPINCLLQGCEHCIFATMAAFEAHCNELHGGVQRYRLRVLHLLSRDVFKITGSMHRAAIANAAEFQCVASTNWHHLSPEQEHVLESGGTLDRESRWHGRSWQACCICAMQYWSEELHKVVVAGPNCCFKNHAAVQKLLDPATYLRTWPEVPSAEMYASCAHLLMHDPALQAGQKQLFPKRLLFIMHKRRMSEAMCNGEKQNSYV